MIRVGTRETISPIFAAALCLRCPRCNAPRGVECRTRGSRNLVWPPHETRVKKCRPRLGGSPMVPRPFSLRGRFLFSEWQETTTSPLGRDERSRELPGVASGSAGNAAVAQPAGASARQVPGVPRIFILVTALVLLFFGCIR